jgi:hypothetical protein
MLEPVKLAEQWRAIESQLPTGWAEVHLRVHISDPSRVEQAAARLGPLGPVRRAQALDLHVEPTQLPLLRRLLARLDREPVPASLEHVHTHDTAELVTHAPSSLAVAWRRELGALPDDWSDAYVELELESSDHIAQAALLLAPCNPSRYGQRTLRFRAARRFGYGTAPEVVARCLLRLDESGIRGMLRFLHALSDTDPVKTQGPVWYVEGKAV